MPQSLPQRARKVSEVLCLIVRHRLIAAEVEGGEERAKGEWCQGQSFIVVGGGDTQDEEYKTEKE
jgi:hypothetical protein